MISRYTKSPRTRKVPMAIRLRADLAALLKTESRKQGRKQIAILERALEHLFAQKPSTWFHAALVLILAWGCRHQEHATCLAALPVIPLPAKVERFYAWAWRHKIALGALAAALWLVASIL